MLVARRDTESRHGRWAWSFNPWARAGPDELDRCISAMKEARAGALIARGLVPCCYSAHGRRRDFAAEGTGCHNIRAGRVCRCWQKRPYGIRRPDFTVVCSGLNRHLSPTASGIPYEAFKPAVDLPVEQPVK